MSNYIQQYIDKTDWRLKENANQSYSYPGMLGYVVSHETAKYALENIYSKEVAEAHQQCYYHLHDLSGLCLYCLGIDSEMLLMKGLNDIDGAPKHFTTALSQLHNLIFLVSQQIAGAVAFNTLDILLAPYIKNDGLTYKQVKQAIQEFVYTINIKGRIGYQCVDQETEVLTPTGFKKYNELNIGDDIYTWNDGQLNIQKVKNVNVSDYDGEMHIYKGRDYIQQVTPNHRVLMKKYNADKFELRDSKDVFDFKTPLYMPVAMEENNIGGIDLSDEMIELLAFVLTEGSIETKSNHNRIRITKSINRWGNERLKEILEKLGFSYSLDTKESNIQKTVNGYYDKHYFINVYSIHAEGSNNVAEILNRTKKDIPDILLKMNKRQAELFIKTWVKLDGPIKENEYGNMKIQCDNMKIADKIQHICFLAGYGSNITTRKIGNNKQDTIYVVPYLRKVKSASVKERVYYKGKVWCPTTDDGVVVFRKDGKVFISGNSPFVNFQLDVTVPERLKGKKPVICSDVVDGKPVYKQMDFTYDDCQMYAEWFNRALLEVMLESKRVLSFPVINIGITKEYDWDNKLSEIIFTSIGKIGQPTINNYVNSDYDPDSVKSMCCSLRLDMAKIKKQTGGSFGAADNSGSIGVITLNLPRYGYEAKGDKQKLFDLIDKYMELAKSALLSKRKFIEEMLQKGMYPSLSRFINDFGSFFNTIGIVGLNEMCLNFLGEAIDTENGKQLAIEVIGHVNSVLSRFQEETRDWYDGRGLYWNAEVSPAEGTMYRFAKHDKEKYHDIIQANGTDSCYYTRGCWLPSDKEYNLIFAAKHQEELQDLFSGGANFQYYINEPIHDWKAVRALIKKLVNNTKLPFISISPSISVCPICGKKDSSQEFCEHELSIDQIKELEQKGVEIHPF